MSTVKYFIVVAIDFGTTYSTYAYSTRDEFETNPLKIFADLKWDAGGVFQAEKTATTVLFDEKRNLRSFGFEAEAKYANLDDSQKKNWYYFSRFKMNLFQRKSYRRNMALKDISGKKMPAIDVFSAAIAYLQNHLLRRVRNRLKDVEDSDFLWVITVPAIWEDGAREFMRKAAIKAHFWEDFAVEKIKGTDVRAWRFNADTFEQNLTKQEELSKQILLALEPETAALYCKFNKLQLIRSEDGVASTAPFAPKQKFLLMDLGGVTADMIAYEVMESDGLRELTEPNGGGWGGVDVDKAFWGLLRKICGDEAFVKFSAEETEDFLDLRNNFELKKRTIQLNPTMDKTSIRVCSELVDIYNKRRGVKLDNDTILSDEGINFRKGHLELSNTVALSLFEETKCNIVEFFKTRYFSNGNIYDLDAIVMVGGFSASEVVQEAVKAAVIDMGISVIIPDEPILAVVKGAVIYGHNRMAIRERVLPYTYGISTRVPFDESVHSIDKKIWCSNRQTYVVEDVFDAFVRAGTRVIPGEFSVECNYRALYYYMGNKAIIEIYRTRNPEPRFVSDQDCSRVGNLELEIPNLPEVRSTQVHIEMCFGDIEERVKAKCIDSNNQIKTEFRFLL
ncbi:hypothetical protein ACJMK2_023901 [Sinanodonta woodiana]|uniref:Uncharacterized protein n=1 Tax=Sinanodonta woodiana TaxID=1069815 RepID=A0ABD3T6I4_SINWO